eukprot:6179466-Pleurochrysis_carterae.AAC.1
MSDSVGQLMARHSMPTAYAMSGRRGHAVRRQPARQALADLVALARGSAGSWKECRQGRGWRGAV